MGGPPGGWSNGCFPSAAWSTGWEVRPSPGPGRWGPPRKAGSGWRVGPARGKRVRRAFPASLAVPRVPAHLPPAGGASWPRCSLLRGLCAPLAGLPTPRSEVPCPAPCLVPGQPAPPSGLGVPASHSPRPSPQAAPRDPGAPAAPGGVQGCWAAARQVDGKGGPPRPAQLGPTGSWRRVRAATRPARGAQATASA